jgi:2-oxoisovalerate dehydrogenase E1 component
MTEHRPLTAASPWVELVANTADWDGADPALLTTMLSQLVLIRTFEEYVLELASAGLVHGPAHSSIGQEGGAVGSILPLTTADAVSGSHRGHHQFLAKALSHVAPKGLDLTAELSDDVRTVLLRTLAEICGLSRGYSHGRGGSMHLKWKEAGAMGTNAIVGGGVPMAAGYAWADRAAGTDAVSVTYFGDGAINIGSTLETFNLASAWHLPICFFIENNQYAVSTSVAEATGEPRLSARGLGFGIPSWKVDGMDPLAVYLAMQEALAHMRAGKGPTMIEADTYRYFHQNGSFPGSAFGYRTKDEETQWRQRDPIMQVAGHLVRRGIMNQAAIDEAVRSAKKVMAETGDLLLEPLPGGKPNQRRIRLAEWPDPAFVDVGVRGDLSEFDDAYVADRDSFAGETAQRKLIDVVAAVMARRMQTDPTIVVMGEDVHRLNGGTNGATRGLKEQFPDRVLGTPISENAFVGLGGGIAVDGRFKPVVELMYADFMWVAADQLFNQIGKARHMFGGDGEVPFVLRSKVATGTGYGSQHSMDPAGIFATAPGWRIVAPSTPFDYVGLMNSALLCKDPVVVLEHVDLYTSIGEGPVDDLDYCLPVGRAAVRRTGSAITVISYLAMVHQVLEAVARLGDVDAEVIDLRWLDRASIDWDTIGESIRKTHNVLIAEQGAIGTSYGGWLADEIQRRFFDQLDQPVQRVTGGEASPSISKVLERAAIAKSEEVAAKLAEITVQREVERTTSTDETNTYKPSHRDTASTHRPSHPTLAGGLVVAAHVDTPHTRMRRAAAARLTESTQDVPHLVMRGTARVDRLLRLRKRLNDDGPVRISVNDLVLTAAARAHVLVPAMNVIWTPDAVRSFSGVDIALAVATEGGIVTPVLRGVDRMAFPAVAEATSDMVRRARSGQLQENELEGGTMTITNLGMFGTQEFAAIINAPQSAKLAVGAAHKTPVVVKGKIRVGTVMKVTLSVDHRPIGGATASRWMAAFVSLLEEPLRILV